MKKNQRGFTLLELLVVIAVIGILASVILASVSSSRGKAKDKAIVSDLLSARTEMEIYLSTKGSFVGWSFDACSFENSSGVGVPATNEFGSPKMLEIMNHIMLTGGFEKDPPFIQDTICGSMQNGNQWIIAAKLSGDNKAWCVDSSGASKEQTLTENIVNQYQNRGLFTCI